MTDRKQASDFDQELLDLYDKYAHGLLSRRGFLDKAARFAVAGATAEGVLQSLSPNYALAEQVAPDDERIVTRREEYDSSKGGGKISGLWAEPANRDEHRGELRGAVLVIHENRGLNPYIEDVARRVAVAGFVAFAPDALSPLGGYPGSDDEGRAMQRQRDRDEMTEDFLAAAEHLSRSQAGGKVGVVGFCFGGGMANTLAARLPGVIAAAAPYYGRQVSASDAKRIKGALQLHYAGLDRRINAGWPAYEKALKQAGVAYEAHLYEGVNHGFHNDTTPRYDAKAAELAWGRTIAFFTEKLKQA